MDADDAEVASEEDPLSTQPLSDTPIGAMAVQIFERLISHSKFVPVMLDMKESALPLPPAAQRLKLQSPIQSVLPLVACQPVAEVSPPVNILSATRNACGMFTRQSCLC